MAQPSIQTLLHSMVTRFRKASAGLLQAQQAQVVQRDKGTYTYLLARPSKRLAVALSVDREFLVLFSPYKEQQQRTIKTARELIAESDGRLESTVAIIVHKEYGGSVKLKKWGRMLGLSVLPVFVDECPPTPEELEHLLSMELFSHDPFDVTGPVSDDENFFGRRNEAQDLARKLQGGQIRSCLGIRKIGKTSVINRIINEARRFHECYCVMMDCSKDEIWKLDASDLMMALADAVNSAQSSAERYSVVTPAALKTEITLSSRKLRDAVSKAGKPILIFVDEIDYITPGSPTTPHWKTEFNPFWRNLRAVYQESLRDSSALSVFVSGVSSKWFSVESVEGVENAALALVPEEYLSPLPRGATIAMIKKISRSAGLVFTDECAGLVSAACSDMPYWVRKACSYIHRQIDISVRPHTLTRDETRDFVRNFIDTEGAVIAQVAIRHLFRVYPELESPALKYSINGDRTLTKIQQTVLSNYGVLLGPPDHTLSGQMLRQGLMLYLDKNLEDATNATAQAASPDSTSSLSDWADDLAIISKERNLLEKRLRQVVVNFIRADVAAKRSTSKVSVKERIEPVLPAERKSKLNHLTADELIEKLLWTELVALIRREWGLFQNILGDKKQFELQSTLINDRFDAHAKDFDAADFALYRRALKWLNERIASL